MLTKLSEIPKYVNIFQQKLPSPTSSFCGFVYPLVSSNVAIENLQLQMIFPVIYDFPMIFPWFLNVCGEFSDIFPIFPYLSHELPFKASTMTGG